ncbi:MAG: septal ring lytic transglycosylase RlpA family protein [Chlorobiaceae bacterium]|nr:septal ring lytic transglycosylase RlpA family protein [Chlorobiaceae bacterium]
MQKTHRQSIGSLLLAAALVFPPSLTGLQAKETENSVTAGHKEQGFFLANRINRDTDSAENSPEKSSGAQAGENSSRFLVGEGRASFYANRFHGQRTASGEHFDRTDYTAAHKSLPFGTKVRVTNLDNGRHVVVKINDRGPHTKGRIIDISQAAARQIGMAGIGNVRIEAYD